MTRSKRPPDGGARNGPRAWKKRTTMSIKSLSKVSLSVSKLFGLSLLAAGLAACVASGEDVAIEGDEADVTAEAEYTRTIVRVDDAGNETVEIQVVTRDQQLLEQEQRQLRLDGEYEGLGTASDGISRDLGCASASIWIYDQVNLEGNEICFYGPGVANLENYCRTGRCGDRWGQNVRSYWAGSEWGRFSIGAGFTCGSSQGTCGQFDPFQKQMTATSCDQQAWYLGIQQLCIPA
jgi:hypothetical protein